MIVGSYRVCFKPRKEGDANVRVSTIWHLEKPRLNNEGGQLDPLGKTQHSSSQGVPRGANTSESCPSEQGPTSVRLPCQPDAWLRLSPPFSVVQKPFATHQTSYKNKTKNQDSYLLLVLIYSRISACAALRVAQPQAGDVPVTKVLGKPSRDLATGSSGDSH